MVLDELRDLITRHARAGVTSTPEGVHVSLVEEAGPPATSTTGTVLAVVAQGAKRLALGDRVLEYRAGQHLVASLDLPVTGQFTEASRERPALGFGLTLRPAVVAELLLHPTAREAAVLRHEPTAPPGIVVADSSPALLDAVVRMLRLLDRPRDLPVLGPMVEREILWLLMTGEQGATVRQLGLADSSLNHVGHAVTWLREHYAEAVRVDDLAQIARMSPSALHRSFRSVTAMSPIQFQKQIRLQAARVRLVLDPRDVAGVAHAVGYESASQFSREYRRQFGAPPAADALRLRATAGTAGALG
ncbi:AraC family transcriptional regulator [Actinotalea subterranea]|uniref:AraC family transcriptional regulator n=1 Tax=Actinotalea subterranea TaxID=2607497 RepID=UPI0011EC6011|nr:AraC family transcriptional regulator [Actinotalea subterranea]